MLRLIILSALLHLIGKPGHEFVLAVGEVIRGRILFDGDEENLDRLPDNARLVVQLQDTSLVDTSAIVLQQIELRNLNTFPISYEMKISTDISPDLSYSLSARILSNDKLLYINAQHVSATMETDRSMAIDIPVISVHSGNERERLVDELEVRAWPEMLGKEGQHAVEYIKEKSGLRNVFTILEHSPVTMDYRTDRVRVVINKNGIVTQVPNSG